jgi:glycosyltransferase involved in cell wall biosynthesis
MAEPEASNSKDCVLFATADWDTPYWTNKQHTAHHLALAGYRVLYIESVGLRAPTMNGRDLKRIWQRLKRGLRPAKLVEPNVWVMSPLAIPFKQHLLIVRAINQGWLRARIRLFMLGQGFKRPMVWTYHPFMRETIATLPHGKVIYHCVDDLSAVPGIDPDSFNREEQRLLAECAVVFVTSLALKDKCTPFNVNTYYFSNVADLDHFGRAHDPGELPPDIAAIPSPRIGYVGALSDFKVDFALIRDVALARSDWHWVVIGAEREGQHSPLVDALRALPNVHFLDDKLYVDLPEYLRGFDVGTLPTLINDYTRSMFPMKYFEYLAAGVPVVSTPLEFTKNYQDGLITAVNAKLFEQGIGLQLHRGRFDASEAIKFVGSNTWVKRLQSMINVLNSIDDK